MARPLDDVEGIGWLLAHGADPGAHDHGDAPLWEAVERRCDRCVEALLAAGAQADVVVWCDSLLGMAIEEGQLQWVQPLVAAGAALEPDPSSVHATPMALALRSGPAAVDALLAAGHPITDEVVAQDARSCALDRLERDRARSPDALDRAEVLGWRGGTTCHIVHSQVHSRRQEDAQWPESR